MAPHSQELRRIVVGMLDGKAALVNGAGRGIGRGIALALAREQFTYDLDQVRAGQQRDPDIRADDVIVVQRNARRTALRDSLFSDILSTLNPFN